MAEGGEIESWRWGGIEAGVAAGTVTWSFATEASLRYAYALTDPRFQDEIRDAFAAWEQVAGIDFLESSGPEGSNIRVGFAVLDGIGGLSGETYLTVMGDGLVVQIVQAEIAFDIDEIWGVTDCGFRFQAAGSFFKSLAIHEIGHAIGLEHHDAEQSVMNSTVPVDVTGLQPCDVAAAQAYYGLVA